MDNALVSIFISKADDAPISRRTGISARGGSLHAIPVRGLSIASPLEEAPFASPFPLKGASFLKERDTKKNKLEKEKPLDRKDMNEKERLFDLLILLQEMTEIFCSEEGIFQREFFSIEKALREPLLDVMEVSAPNNV
jgi:hypothetical protein